MSNEREYKLVPLWNCLPRTVDFAGLTLNGRRFDACRELHRRDGGEAMRCVGAGSPRCPEAVSGSSRSRLISPLLETRIAPLVLSRSALYALEPDPGCDNP